MGAPGQGVSVAVGLFSLSAEAKNRDAVKNKFVTLVVPKIALSRPLSEEERGCAPPCPSGCFYPLLCAACARLLFPWRSWRARCGSSLSGKVRSDPCVSPSSSLFSSPQRPLCTAAEHGPCLNGSTLVFSVDPFGLLCATTQEGTRPTFRFALIVAPQESASSTITCRIHENHGDHQQTPDQGGEEHQEPPERRLLLLFCQPRHRAGRGRRHPSSA